jgi:predicted enzyme related to lactoylglutathione lyase
MSNTINIRYIVDDVDEAIPFYRMLGFTVDIHPAPPFAALSKNGVTLYLNQPSAGGGGKAMSDGTAPEPGGWNRIQIQVDYLTTEVETLRDSGASFRNDIVEGQGGKQILLEDPAGNPIELFESTRD